MLKSFEFDVSYVIYANVPFLHSFANSADKELHEVIKLTSFE